MVGHSVKPFRRMTEILGKETEQREHTDSYRTPSGSTSKITVEPFFE